jgi:hypothetical protein
MKRKRWLGYLVIIISLIAISGWWLLTYTPPPTATIGYFGENKFLCVRPGQLIRLRFSKPLPSGWEEWQKEMQQKGLGDYVKGTHPETVAEAVYWHSIGAFEWWYVSEREIVYRVPTGIYAIYPVYFPSPRKLKSGEKFELMLFIMGDKDLDGLIQRQEPLPPNGKVPSKGTVEIYYSEPSLWVHFRFWLHQKFWEYGF